MNILVVPCCVEAFRLTPSVDTWVYIRMYSPMKNTFSVHNNFSYILELKEILNCVYQQAEASKTKKNRTYTLLKY